MEQFQHPDGSLHASLVTAPQPAQDNTALTSSRVIGPASPAAPTRPLPKTDFLGGKVPIVAVCLIFVLF